MAAIVAVLLSFVVMLVLLVVTVAAFLAKFMAPALAIGVTSIVVVLGLGRYPWRRLRIAARLGERDIRARVRRLSPSDRHRIGNLLPVRYAGVGQYLGRLGAQPPTSTPETMFAGVPVANVRRLARHNLFLVLTRDTVELWKHAPVRFAPSVVLDRSTLESVIVWDHDPEHYKTNPDITLKLVYDRTPLWLDVRHRVDAGSVGLDLERTVKQRRGTAG